MIYNYNLQLNVTYTPEKEIKKGEALKERAVFKSNGKALKRDDVFYKEFKGKFFKEITTGKTNEVELLSTGNGFEGEYIIPEEGVYEAKVRLEGENMYRESTPVNLKPVKPTEPVSPVVTQPIQPEKETLKPDLTLVAGVGGALLLMILLLLIRKNRRLKKKSDDSKLVKEKIRSTAANGEFSGRFMISIRNDMQYFVKE